jgi:hypothetical protein
MLKMEEYIQFKTGKNSFLHSIFFNELGKLCQKSPFQNHWSLLYIKDLGLNSWEMGVLTITRIPPKGGQSKR